MSSAAVPEFGPNDWFVEEKYQQFLADPQSVDPIWRDFFADNGSGKQAARAAHRPPQRRPATPQRADRRPPTPAAPARTQPAAGSAATAAAGHRRPASPSAQTTATTNDGTHHDQHRTSTSHSTPTAAARPGPHRNGDHSPRAAATGTGSPPVRAEAGRGRAADRTGPRRWQGIHRRLATDQPAGPAGDHRHPGRHGRGEGGQGGAGRPGRRGHGLTTTPLRGVAAAVVKNMTSSLEVPTATSVRAVPAKLMADNRIVINNFLKRNRGGKISFTHLIGYAIVRAIGDLPEHEPALRGGRRQAADGHAGARQPRPGHRPARQGRRPEPGGGADQERRGDELHPVLELLRAGRPQGPGRHADRRGLRRHHHLADQPGRHRHQPLGAAADVRAERHHRRRRAGVPGRVPGRQRSDPVRAGHLQDHHADLDLRPPGHPGRRVRRVPAPHPPAADRRGRLLRRRLHLAAAALRAGALGQGPRHRPARRGRQDRPGAGDHRRLPHPRSPDGRHRSAELPAAPAPRPGRALATA